MHTIKASELPRNAADVLQAVRTGATVTITHYGKPIAQITPYAGEPTGNTADLPGRIRAAYDQIAAGPGRYVALVDLRAALADIDHDTLTRALHALHVEQDLTLTPEENRRSITPEDRAAAVVIGDEPRHLISYDR